MRAQSSHFVPALSGNPDKVGTEPAKTLTYWIVAHHSGVHFSSRHSHEASQLRLLIN